MLDVVVKEEALVVSRGRSKHEGSSGHPECAPWTRVRAVGSGSFALRGLRSSH